MSDFASLMGYIHTKIKEVGKPLTINEFVKYAGHWPHNKITRLIRKVYLVASDNNARYSYGYSITVK